MYDDHLLVISPKSTLILSPYLGSPCHPRRGERTRRDASFISGTLHRRVSSARLSCIFASSSLLSRRKKREKTLISDPSGKPVSPTLQGHLLSPPTFSAVSSTQLLTRQKRPPPRNCRRIAVIYFSTVPFDLYRFFTDPGEVDTGTN